VATPTTNVQANPVGPAVVISVAVGGIGFTPGTMLRLSTGGGPPAPLLPSLNHQPNVKAGVPVRPDQLPGCYVECDVVLSPIAANEPYLVTVMAYQGSALLGTVTDQGMLTTGTVISTTQIDFK
jgi:hypothetical protein